MAAMYLAVSQLQVQYPNSPQPAVAGGSWQYSVLHYFTGNGDGCFPSSGFASDSAGNFFGITPMGGTPSNHGTVFEVTPQ